MADYRVGIGHDLPYLGLYRMVQEPAGHPIAPVERKYGVSNRHHEQSHFIVFTFDVLESEDLYLALLTQFGLNVNDTSDVTVNIRDERLTWTRYNGVAHLPEINADTKWNQFFFKEVKIYVTDLEEIA